MLYERYEKRMNKAMFILSQLYRFRVLLIVVFSTFFASLSGFGVLKGQIYEDSVPELVPYSEEIEISSKAYFSSVSYLYRVKGEETWTIEKPLDVGVYEVLITSPQVFGGTNEVIREFEIVPKEVTASIKNSAISFGEDPTLLIPLKEGDYIEDVSYTYSDTSIGNQTVTIEDIVIKNSLGKDVSLSYQLKNTSFDVVIEKRDISILLIDKEDIYKGVPLTSEDIEIMSGSLVLGDEIIVTASGSQLEVGSSINTILEAQVNREGVDVTENYNITFTDGLLEVTERNITVSTSDVTRVYNGTELSESTVVVSDGMLVVGHTIEVLSHASITNVGTVENFVTIRILDENLIDVTSNYDVTYDFGTLEITKAPLHIETASSTKVYDDEELSNLNYEVTSGSLLNDDEIVVIEHATMLNQGTIPNILSIQIINGETDVTSNYDVSFTYGTLEINKLELTIQTNSESFTYNGNPFFNEGFVLVGSSVLESHEVVVVSHKEITNVDTIDNELNVDIIDDLGNIVSDNYEITYLYGTLEVLPQSITVKAVDKEFEYDGKVHTSNLGTVVNGFFVSGHTLELTTTGSITNVGSVLNEITSVTVYDGQIDVTNNYNITFESGEIVVTKHTMTIALFDVSKEYDGEELTSHSAYIFSGDLMLGHQVVVTTNGSITDVGEVDNIIETITVYDGEVDVTNNYDFVEINGILVVTKREIVVKPVDQEKVYDGEVLSSSNFEIVEGSLIGLDTLEIFTTDSIVNVGSIDNHIDSYTIMNNGMDVSSNYNVVLETGTLTVTRLFLKIEANSDEKVYDGVALSNNGFTVTGGTLLDQHTITAVISSSIVDAGLQLNTFDSVRIFDGETDVTANYDIQTVNGLLVVTQKDITVKPLDVSRVYNGQVLRSDVLEVVNGELIGEDEIVILTSGSIINAGTTVNEIYDYQFTSGNPNNYNVTTQDGQLEVFKRLVIFTVLDQEKVYDGEEFIGAQFVEVENLISSHDYSYGTTSILTNVGVIDNEIDAIHISNGRIDVTDNYEIVVVKGTLTITPREIYVKPIDVTKVYDGLELRSNNVTLVDSFLAFGQTMITETTGSITNVGVTTNIITNVIIKDGDTDVTSNYNINVLPGEMEVIKRSIEITSGSSSKEYDGVTLSNPGFYVSGGSLATNEGIYVLDYPEIINVSTIDNILSLVIRNSELEDTTDNYEIDYVYGTLSISTRTIHISTGSAVKEYDGTPLSNPNYSITAGNIALNQSLNISVLPEIVNAQVLPNEIEFQVLDEALNDVTSNYEFTIDSGTLEITQRNLLIQTESASKEYDGTSLSNQNYSLIDGEIAFNQTLNVNAFAEIINVSTIDNILSFVVLDEGLNDVSENYNITVNPGQLTITKRDLVVTTSSSIKEYDGSPLFNQNYTVNSGSVALNQSVSISGYSSITNVGVIDNDLLITILDSSFIDVSLNYNITVNYGTLEVTPKSITITTSTNQDVYDGEAFFDTGFTISEGDFVLGDYGVVETYSSITNVGLINNIFEVSVYNGATNVSSNYDITYIYGTLEVTKRDIILKLTDVVKEYDGLALTSTTTEDVGAFGVVLGHVVEVVSIGSQTTVGVSNNFLQSVVIFDGDTDVTSNYNISYQDGTLEVIKRPITILTGTASKEYDGLVLSDQTISIIDGSFAENQILHVIGSSEITIVGVTDNIFDYVILDENTSDVTSNYDITMEYGFLEVTPREITISTVSDTKEYDGTPLTNDTYQISDGTVIGNHTLNINVTGSITEVGKDWNTFEYQILDEELNDVSMYYIVTQNQGILEVVTSKEILVIKSDSDTKVYDGTPLTNDGYEIISGSLAFSHTIEVTVIGTITEVGDIENMFTVIIRDSEGIDVTSEYYYIEYEYGILTILNGDENGVTVPDGTDIDDVGDLNSGSGSPVFEVFSELSDVVYLRGNSFGDYNKRGFDGANPYVSPYSLTPFLFPNIAIEGVINPYRVEVRTLQSGLPYLVPYYAINGFYDNINDVYVNHPYGTGYVIDYMPLSTVDYNEFTISDPIVSIYEEEYRTFVYDNYLALPRETKEELLRIAAENGLDPNSETIISDVQNYIRSVGVYNIGFSQIPENADVALYFLEESREGICQHFATAGVVMYRALGIPARYTTGYLAETVGNEWTEVSTLQAHAWVEIYIDGFGWIPVDVTDLGVPDGTGDGSGTGSGGGTGSGDEPTLDPNLPTIEIVTLNDSKIYDGTPLTNTIWYKIGSLQSGHTLNVTVVGSQTLVGESDNRVVYTVTDSFGNDVSDQYNIVTNYGKLVVVSNNQLEILEIQLYDVTKVYSGDIIEHKDTEYWLPSNNLPEGYTLTFDIVGSIINVGKVFTYIDPSSIVILDENNIDVTNQYNVVTYKGSITVNERNITVNSFSAQKEYDGTALTSDVYYISRGSVATGDVMIVTITGSITDPGIEYNTIESIIITNEFGEDVTENYNISTIEGTLVVNPESN